MPRAKKASTWNDKRWRYALLFGVLLLVILAQLLIEPSTLNKAIASLIFILILVNVLVAPEPVARDERGLILQARELIASPTFLRCVTFCVWLVVIGLCCYGLYLGWVRTVTVTLAGDITDEDGSLVDGATVTVFDGPRRLSSVVSRNGGKFSLRFSRDSPQSNGVRLVTTANGLVKTLQLPLASAQNLTICLPPRNSLSQEAKYQQTLHYLKDALQEVAGGLAGVRNVPADPDGIDRWQTNVIGMLYDVYKDRQSDVCVTWLRPQARDDLRLSVYLAKNLNLPKEHYAFRMGEGLAGKVWETGSAAATSLTNRHPWWVYREGCFNVSYICVPVGPAKSEGGVLAVGSDQGFTVEECDTALLELFAAVLSLSLKNSS